jgi:hypothetical protein
MTPSILTILMSEGSQCELLIGTVCDVAEGKTMIIQLPVGFIIARAILMTKLELFTLQTSLP